LQGDLCKAVEFAVREWSIVGRHVLEAFLDGVDRCGSDDAVDEVLVESTSGQEALPSDFRLVIVAAGHFDEWGFACQVWHRVYSTPAFDHLEMQVGSGRRPSRADNSQGVALLDSVPDLEMRPVFHVRVKRLKAVAMV